MKKLLTLLTILVTLQLSMSAATIKMTQAADKAIKEKFPTGKILKIGQERERGAFYYEVVMKDKNKRFEVEVSPKGVIGEVESKVGPTEIPADLLTTMRKRAGTGKIVRVEKHERYGIARNAEFKPLKEPQLFYDVKYVDQNGRRREFQVASNEVLEIPNSARQKLLMLYPKSKIVEVEAEQDEKAIIYVAILKTPNGRVEAGILGNGQMVEAEIEVPLSKSPKGITNTFNRERILKKTDEIKVYQHKSWGQVISGNFMSQRVLSYRVKAVRGTLMREYSFNSKGQLLNKPKWEQYFPDDDSDENEEDDNY